MNGRGTLIICGYGVVGQRIAANLAPDYPDRVIIVGRNLGQVQETAAAMGHSIRGRQIDTDVSKSSRECRAASSSSIRAIVMTLLPPAVAAEQHAITVPALPHHDRLLIFLDVDDHAAEAGVGKALARVDLGDPQSIQVASTLLGRRMVCSPG
jgi:hypothetical protein